MTGREDLDGNAWCPRHDGGRGAWLPAREFGLSGRRTGSRYRGYCRACFRRPGVRPHSELERPRLGLCVRVTHSDALHALIIDGGGCRLAPAVNLKPARRGSTLPVPGDFVHWRSYETRLRLDIAAQFALCRRLLEARDRWIACPPDPHATPFLSPNA